MQVLTTKTNYATNPNFETGTTNWSPYVENGIDPPPTLATDTVFVYGTKSLKITPGVTTGFTGASMYVTGLTVGQTYTVSCYVKSA